MNESFWHQCWERNSLGFHQETVHPFLEQYLLPLLNKNETAAQQHVFVPLCGKSLDMVWLAEYMKVTGAELSEIACRDFFSEKDLDYRQKSQLSFNIFSYENVELWQGDFFQLTQQDITKIDWVYDRAALIALPESMQQQYAHHLIRFLSDETTLFLVTLEFPSEEMSGPPFAIFENDVARLFSGCNIECIAERNLEDKVFAQRKFNVSYLKERLYLIKR